MFAEDRNWLRSAGKQIGRRSTQMNPERASGKWERVRPLCKAFGVNADNSLAFNLRLSAFISGLIGFVPSNMVRAASASGINLKLGSYFPALKAVDSAEPGQEDGPAAGDVMRKLSAISLRKGVSS